jgi:hypothetical protein
MRDKFLAQLIQSDHSPAIDQDFTIKNWQSRLPKADLDDLKV